MQSEQLSALARLHVHGIPVRRLRYDTPTRTGANVSVANAGYNGNLSSNGTTSFGFTGTQTGTNAPPTTFTCAPA
ncbi:cellulose binding domain-containing protein [Nonomuraea sp. H19]|uniref:cellulose binding domain-containing protein n=1 Tax=Nonomuraea sp. H19 TaxID=3452206 RepID=UPI003F8B3940